MSESNTSRYNKAKLEGKKRKGWNINIHGRHSLIQNSTSAKGGGSWKL